MRIHGKLSNKNGWKTSKMEIKYKNVKISKNNNDKLLFKKKHILLSSKSYAYWSPLGRFTKTHGKVLRCEGDTDNLWFNVRMKILANGKKATIEREKQKRDGGIAHVS